MLGGAKGNATTKLTCVNPIPASGAIYSTDINSTLSFGFAGLAA